MRKNLLEFLFGLPVVEDAKLGEHVVSIFEEAADEEAEQMVANKKPLTDALKALGLGVTVDAGTSWAEIKFDNDADYKEAVTLLSEPDAMHKLAEMGWVMAKCGDRAMSNEEPELRIGFIEIATAEGGDDDKADEKPKEIAKQGRERDTTELDRDDDDLNPVETDDGEMGGKTTGVGKAKDGEAPEGKPKGSTKKTEAIDKLLPAPPLNEMTTASAIPPVEAAPPMKKRKTAKPDVKRTPHR